MSNETTPSQQISHSSAAAAFKLWETKYRTNPADFLTREEVAAMEVATLSEERAIYFLALLRKVNRA